MGDYMLITMAVSLTISNISLLIGDYARMYENSIHYNKSAEVGLYREPVKEAGDHEKLEFQLLEHIKISNLSFSYPNSSGEVLHDINLTINVTAQRWFECNTKKGYDVPLK
jgi:ABC-type bacteriocin/lantibiotic exporter with double-glycine peptidase domain